MPAIANRRRKKAAGRYEIGIWPMRRTQLTAPRPGQNRCGRDGRQVSTEAFFESRRAGAAKNEAATHTNAPLCVCVCARAFDTTGD
ncbi:unnamed protein product, partial [Iphiclides podalirius]